jgi:hypothetical protein
LTGKKKPLRVVNPERFGRAWPRWGPVPRSYRSAPRTVGIEHCTACAARRQPFRFRTLGIFTFFGLVAAGLVLAAVIASQ